MDKQKEDYFREKLKNIMNADPEIYFVRGEKWSFDKHGPIYSIFQLPKGACEFEELPRN